LDGDGDFIIISVETATPAELSAVELPEIATNELSIIEDDVRDFSVDSDFENIISVEVAADEEDAGFKLVKSEASIMIESESVVVMSSID
jgi:hypothetical protein